MARDARRYVVIAVLAVAALACATAVAKSGHSTPRCFGAASRDKLHPCHNPALRFTVTPKPRDALITPDPTRCTVVDAPISVCEYGAPLKTATRFVATVGDSHADHWRSAIAPAARKLGWAVYSVTHGSCPFTEAQQVAPDWKRSECTNWNQAVHDWFSQHPEISAIFTSDHPAPVDRAPGESMMDAWVKGILGAWDKLPANVQHILVIRDLPFIHDNTLPCVEHAVKRHLDAGHHCSLRRAAVVHHDPDVVAAQREADRAQVIDLTNVFCDKRCYPVIGGALVYKDYFEHMTSVFGRTLAPFILRDVKRATASWGASK